MENEPKTKPNIAFFEKQFYVYGQIINRLVKDGKTNTAEVQAIQKIHSDRYDDMMNGLKEAGVLE